MPGAWVRISMSAEGLLTAVSATGEPRDVRHLSLGTCQQLYLSLRMAMLMHARDVGRAVPVIADDMLVHFDATRRAAAAQALARLAEKRQVIVFTCHRETTRPAQRPTRPDLPRVATTGCCPRCPILVAMGQRGRSPLSHSAI